MNSIVIVLVPDWLHFPGFLPLINARNIFKINLIYMTNISYRDLEYLFIPPLARTYEIVTWYISHTWTP